MLLRLTVQAFLEFNQEDRHGFLNTKLRMLRPYHSPINHPHTVTVCSHSYRKLTSGIAWGRTESLIYQTCCKFWRPCHSTHLTYVRLRNAESH